MLCVNSIAETSIDWFILISYLSKPTSDTQQCSYVILISWLIHRIRSLFSNETELVQNLQCSYTKHSAWKIANKHWDFLSSFWLLFRSDSFVFYFFHVLRTKRSGFKPYGSHIIGSWIPWILWIALDFSSTWWLLLEKGHLVTFKFYINKICGLHRLRKIAKIQLSSLIVLILFRMNSLIELSTDRNEVSNNVMYFLYWILCWCLVITNTSL